MKTLNKFIDWIFVDLFEAEPLTKEERAPFYLGMGMGLSAVMLFIYSLYLITPTPVF